LKGCVQESGKCQSCWNWGKIYFLIRTFIFEGVCARIW
jgi:hypothetical protein